MIARRYNSGFPEAHDSYNSLSCGPDGKIYYVLSSASVHVGGKVFCYDPGTDEVEPLGDLTDICGESGSGRIPQGKCHSLFYEYRGDLYFSTHTGIYEMRDGMERLPNSPMDGRDQYPGGHILRYNLQNRTFDDLAIMPRGEGVVTMTMDRQRGTVYALTWPTGHLVRVESSGGQIEDLGPVSAKGEAGTPGSDYRPLCRAMLVDPRSGNLYYTTPDGTIWTLDQGGHTPKALTYCSMKRDYFGQYVPTQAGTMAWHWRQIHWDEREECAWGVHGNSGYLFRFDPASPTLELVERITSEPSRRSGMFDQFSYGYLGFVPGPDGETLYYLTGGPLFDDQGRRIEGVSEISKGGAKGEENLHLVTWHIPSESYRDHGPIHLNDGSRPSYVNSIAVGLDRSVYFLTRMERDGETVQDLAKLPPIGIAPGV